ncbi:MAG: QueG-associated DUF1730 domain-containing protein [Alistipes indistinctus]
MVCAISYNRPPAAGVASRIASYARGRDYHPVLKEKLHELLAYIRDLHPGTSGRVFVDTAPILEKSWAAEAGVGRIGRHSLLIVPGAGIVRRAGSRSRRMPNSNPIPPFWHSQARAVPARAYPTASRPRSARSGNDRTIATLRFCISRRTDRGGSGRRKATSHGWIVETCVTFASWLCPTTAMHRYPLHTCAAPAGEHRTGATETDWLQLSGTDFQNRFWQDTPLAPLRTGRIQTPHPARFTRNNIQEKSRTKQIYRRGDISLQRFFWSYRAK